MPLLVTGKTMAVQVEGVSLCMAGLCCRAADGGGHVPWLELRGLQVALACIVCSSVLATRLLTHLAVGEDISEVLCPIRLGEPGSLVLLRTKAASLGASGGLFSRQSRLSPCGWYFLSVLAEWTFEMAEFCL